VKRLVKDADILVENYRPGTIEKWGPGPRRACGRSNPGLIVLRVTGFGQTGPNGQAGPASARSPRAYAGYVYISGVPEGPPLLPGFGLADATTGLMAAYLASVALHEKRRSGEGQVIDLALYETLLTLLGTAGGQLRPARDDPGACRLAPAFHGAAQHLPHRGRQVSFSWAVAAQVDLRGASAPRWRSPSCRATRASPTTAPGWKKRRCAGRSAAGGRSAASTADVLMRRFVELEAAISR
jgi:hypothetical protein